MDIERPNEARIRLKLTLEREEAIWHDRVNKAQGKKLSPPVNCMTAAFWITIDLNEETLFKPFDNMFSFCFNLLRYLRYFEAEKKEHGRSNRMDAEGSVFDRYQESLGPCQVDTIDRILTNIENNLENNKREAFNQRMNKKFGLFRPEDNLQWSDLIPYQTRVDQREDRLARRGQNDFDTLRRRRVLLESVEILDLAVTTGLSCRQIATTLDLKPSKVRRIIREIRNGDFEEKVAIGLPFFNRRNQRFSGDLLEFIDSQVTMTEGCITLRELQSRYRLLNVDNRVPCIHTFGRKLRQMGMTKKKVAYIPENRNSKINKEKRKIFFCEFIRHLETPGDLVVAVDETGINFESSCELHWAPKGTLLKKTSLRPKVINISCLIATSRLSIENALFIEGGCDSLLFLHFINNLVTVLEHKKNIGEVQYSRLIILMDNAVIHYSRPLSALVKAKEMVLLFTAPYTPMGNPAEYANRDLKVHLRRHPVPR